MASNSNFGLKKKPPMYYKKGADRELIRHSDLGLEDSGDPMQGDGYDKEDSQSEVGQKNFAVGMQGDQKTGLASKLRKKGMPKA